MLDLVLFTPDVLPDVSLKEIVPALGVKPGIFHMLGKYVNPHTIGYPGATSADEIPEKQEMCAITMLKTVCY